MIKCCACLGQKAIFHLLCDIDFSQSVFPFSPILSDSTGEEQGQRQAFPSTLWHSLHVWGTGILEKEAHWQEGERLCDILPHYALAFLYKSFLSKCFSIHCIWMQNFFTCAEFLYSVWSPWTHWPHRPWVERLYSQSKDFFFYFIYFFEENKGMTKHRASTWEMLRC